MDIVFGQSVQLSASPLVGDGPTSIAYREMGAGTPPLLSLHGGWGYQIYPIDPQAEALAPQHLVLVPDRSGYGRSTPISALPVDFHRRAMEESLLFLDALGIEGAIWWGHSDGAVIAALAGIERPDRVSAVILEACHLYRRKPRSRAFFEQMVTDPLSFGPKVTSILEADHGKRWREVLGAGGRAWLDIADYAQGPQHDLFDGRLATLQVPAMVIHGGCDPRTEPGELEAVRAALPHAELAYYPTAGHCPHREWATASSVAEAICRFVATVPAPEAGRQSGGI